MGKQNTMLDLHQILFYIRKYIAVILLSAVFGTMAGYFLSAYVMTPIYSASADMIVNNKSSLDDQAIMSSSDITASNYLADTYSIILKSHDVLEMIIDDLDLDYSYRDLSDRISISAINNTQIIRLKVKDPDPQKALDILQKLVSIAPEIIVEKAEVGSVKVIDTPWSSGVPVEPNITRACLVGAALAELLCLAIITIAHLASNTFKSEDDLMAVFDEPLLGIIPYIHATSRKDGKRHARKTSR